MATVRAVVRGRVQGVGFRYFVLRMAQEKGLVGEVWNRSDGAVEAVFQHRDAALIQEALAELRQGPGSVESVDSAPDSAPPFEAFRIVHR